MNKKNLENSTELVQLTRAMLRKLIAEYNKQLPDRLSSAQYSLLGLLYNDECHKSSYLAECLQITLSAVTNLANKLVDSGYALRIPLETDRRVVQLQITDKGREAFQQLDKGSAVIISNFWSKLSMEEIDQLNAILQKTLHTN